MATPDITLTQALAIIGCVWVLPAAIFAKRAIDLVHSDRMSTPEGQYPVILGVLGAASIAMLAYAVVF